MQSDELRRFARDVLNLGLSEADAAKAVSGLGQLGTLVKTIEGVPLGFLGEPFTAPKLGDAWLEDWHEEP